MLTLFAHKLDETKFVSANFEEGPKKEISSRQGWIGDLINDDASVKIISDENREIEPNIIKENNIFSYLYIKYKSSHT